MINKLAHIIKGWGKAFGILSVTEAEQKLSELRLSICTRCEYAQSSKVLEIVNGHGRYENIIKCGKCKCPCQQKSLVTDEKCPLEKW